MSSNKSIRDAMEHKYGSECWIDKLHLRPDTDKITYKSKGQMKRMKQLTYHHIKEKSKGGRATESNGALLSAENHEWFHQQPIEIQKKLNQIFQEYKSNFNKDTDTVSVIEHTKHDTLSYDNFMTLAKNRYNRAKEKRDTQKLIDEILEER